MSDKPKGTDYVELAQSVEDLKEMLSALRAGLIADGYSDEQAKWIVTGLMTSHIKSIDSYGGGA